MNGIISEQPSRDTPAPKPLMISTVILGTCLFGGFASGINITPSALAAMNPFRTETLHFDKIAWISHEVGDGLKTMVMTYVEEQNKAESLTFTPYELSLEKIKRFHLRSLHPDRSSFKKLDQAVHEIAQATHYDAYEDYQMAITRLRGEFSLALNETPGPLPPQIIAMTSSSAETVVATPVPPSPTKTRMTAQSLLKQDLYLDPPMLMPQTAPLSMATQTVSSQKIQPSARTQKPVRERIDQPVVMTPSKLNQKEKEKLTNELLAVQISAQANQPYYQFLKREKIAQTTKVRPLIQINESASEPDPIEPQTLLGQNVKANFEAAASPTNQCTQLSTQTFIMAGGNTSGDVATQVCAGEVSWISKPFSGSAWVKVSGDRYLSTMTMNPAPNGGSTLLLDSNALGLIAIKSGVHVTKGMGIIVGRVPDGFKISFLGRAEETEYFDSNGKKYFAILNAEPGAGVVELESKLNPNVSSTVFTPVLEDTVSYLDLTAPIVRSLKIKVVKNNAANDPEVAKLTVGLSTQAAIQAITRETGQAILKSVNLVPGFPVYVDVSSHTADSEGYTYRYELKHPQANGIYIVNQVAEKTIRHWLKQVKQGLSDQSAMVVGFLNRERLDGFKNLHTTQVESLTAKYGLEPINYTVLWDGKISLVDPLEGDIPRFMSVQIPEGLSQVKILNEAKQTVSSDLIPISARIIHVITD